MVIQYLTTDQYLLSSVPGCANETEFPSRDGGYAALLGLGSGRIMLEISFKVRVRPEGTLVRKRSHTDWGGD